MPAMEPSVVDSILAHAATTLELAKDLAPLIPIPYVISIFAYASVIVNAASTVRQNKKDCAILAKRVAELSLDVNKTVHGHEELIDDTLKSALEKLANHLNDILHFMKRQSSRKFIPSFLERDNISWELTLFTSQLDFAMQTFKTTSSIRLELKLECVAQSVDIVKRIVHHERKWDGQYRIYRLADLHLLHCIRQEERRELFDNEVYSVGYYTGEIKGRTVTVKIQRGALKSFRESLSALQGIRHVNVAQLEGHSVNTDPQFLVVKGDLRPQVDYMMSLPWNQRVPEYFGVMSSVWSAATYLLNHGHRYYGNGFTLMRDMCTGKVIVGVQDVHFYLSAGGKRVYNLRFDNLLHRGAGNTVSTATFAANKVFECQYAANRSLYHAVSGLGYEILSLETAISLWFQGHIGYFSPSVVPEPFTGDAEPIQHVGIRCFRPQHFFAPLKELPSSLLRLSKIKPLHRHVQIRNNNNIWEAFDSRKLLQSSSQIEIFARTWTGVPVPDVPDAFKYLALHGSTIAHEHGIDLTNLIIILQHFKNYYAESIPKASIVPTANTTSQLFFHTRPLEDGQRPSPWGYFSESTEPVPEGEPLPVRAVLFPKVDSKYHGREDIFESTLPGVSARTSVKVEHSIAKLSPTQAETIKWICEHFTHTSPGSADAARIIEGS